MLSRLGGLFGATVYTGMAALYAWVIIRATHLALPVRVMLGAVFICLVCGIVAFLARRQNPFENASRRVQLFVLFTTYTPLLAQWQGKTILPEAGWFGAVFALLMTWCGLSLGRSFGWVPANRGICKRGPYRFIRHPMYSAYAMVMAAFICINYTPWNVVVCVVSAFLGILFSYLEEGVLRKDPEYVAYAEEVPYRFIPGVV